MTGSWWERLYEIVDRARELEGDERERYLAEACADDAELLAEVQKILAASPPTDFMEPETGPLGFVAPEGDLTGLVLGDFELGEVIGRGGMGIVYLARQVSLDRPAVVKVLPMSHRSHPDAVERFQRESRAASRLNHDGIVGVLASGESEGRLWFAMPYVEGHDLNIELEAQRDSRTVSPLLPSFGSDRYVRTVVERVATIADALDHAHAEGVIHRDVKPRNLLLNSDGKLLLGDFGLAKVQDAPALTRTGMVQGTPHYMSPEQARAARNSIGPATDVYSLCVVLYEMLSLRRPFDGDSVAEVLDRITTGAHTSLRKRNPRIARDLAVISEKGMALRASDRYPTARELSADLRRFLQHESIEARPLPWYVLVRRRIGRHPAIATAVAILVIGIVVAFFWAEYRADQRQRGAWTSRIAAALELDDWRGQETRVADAVRAVAQVTRAGALDGELATLVRTLDGRLETEVGERITQIEQLLRQGRGGAEVRPDLANLRAPPSLLHLFQGLREASRLEALGADDPRIAQIADVEQAFPALRIELSPRQDHLEDASGPPRAIAAALDSISGEFSPAEPLGELPVETRLPPGDWRIVVELPGVGFAEYDRDLQLDVRTETIAARVRRPADVTAGMKELPSATLELEGDLGCCPVRAQASVDAFWIAEAEVSNRDYVAFLDDTGHARPFLWGILQDDHPGDWRRLRGDPRWLDLPAVGMSYFDMRDYAEWAGCRLPTHYELEYALRYRRAEDGSATALFRELPAEVSANRGGRTTGTAHNELELYQLYVAETVEVRDPAYRQPPHDLFHIHGNVAERTSSKLTRIVGGQVRADDWSTLYFGSAWDAIADGDQPFEHPAWGLTENHATVDVGFRCARSVAVDSP